MTLLDTWLQTPAASALGWTLVHFVWEGAVVALALALALCVIRSSRARYAAACLAMLGMLMGFGLTFARMQPQRFQRAATVESRSIPHGSIEQWPKNPTPRRASDFLPWLVPFWIAGVLLFHLRILASWIAAQRLRRTGVCCAPDLWQQRLNRLGARLRLSTPVTLLESCLAGVPVVIGHLRPVILMPVGLLTGLPAGQIESILLHELAHIRRCDYLVNLLQTSMEGLLFYHPAVWWISGVMRAERENCCDDVVVSIHGDAREYAVALATLEQNRCAVREAALAATGGNLVKRIHRLLDKPEGPRAALTPAVSAGVLTIAAALALAAWQSKPAGQLLAQAQTQAPPAVSPAPSPYDKWLNEDIVYIVSPLERAVFKGLATDAEREKFIEQFWLRRDPENKVKKEHYRRIAYSNERFGRPNLAGWKTDRGRIYITWGPPDEIEDHRSGGMYKRPPEEGGGVTSTSPFQQWRYRSIEGVGTNIIIEFVDTTMSGDFRMSSDPHEKYTVPFVPGQSGGQVFVSPEPGKKVTVEITPDRRMLINIPLDFDAAQYIISGSTRASDGRKDLGDFTAVWSLCQDSPQEFGCLVRPVFQPDSPFYGRTLLEPGSYVFDAVVKDRAGVIKKTYSVSFSVR
jgi:GWxTD domain-containing protein